VCFTLLLFPLEGKSWNVFSYFSKVLDLPRHQQDSSSTTSTDTTDDMTDTAIYGESSYFLWLADVLEVILILVLAVPACAAILTVLPLTSHRTFVNFLFHSILPQDQWLLSKQAELKDADKVLV
jgi:hypothetical protein